MRQCRAHLANPAGPDPRATADRGLGGPQPIVVKRKSLVADNQIAALLCSVLNGRSAGHPADAGALCLIRLKANTKPLLQDSALGWD